MSTPKLVSVRTGDTTDICGKAAICPDCGKALLFETADLAAAREDTALLDFVLKWSLPNITREDIRAARATIDAARAKGEMK